MRRRTQGHPLDVEPTSKLHPTNFQTTQQVVRIMNVEMNEMEQVLRDFGKEYELSLFFEQLEIMRVGDFSWVATPKEPLPFETFCYLVNYLEYPIGKKWKAAAIGWTNFESKESTPLDPVPEPLMVYVPEVDDSYDQVLITSASGIGYKCAFKKMTLEYVGDGGKIYQNPPLLP